MENILKKELLYYYIEKENSTNSTRLEIINIIIKRINLILKLSKYENINKLIIYEKKSLKRNCMNQLLYDEYNSLLNRLIKKINIKC